MSIGEVRGVVEAGAVGMESIAGRLGQAIEPRERLDGAVQRVAKLLSELGVAGSELDTASADYYEQVHYAYDGDDVSSAQAAAAALEGSASDVPARVSSFVGRHEDSKKASLSAASTVDRLSLTVAAATRQVEDALRRIHALPDARSLEESSTEARGLADDLSNRASTL